MDEEEPTLEEVQREFQGWNCYRGTSGRYCASRGNVWLAGEDPLDLRDQLIAWTWKHEATS